jgi:hypothetical protein
MSGECDKCGNHCFECTCELAEGPRNSKELAEDLYKLCTPIISEYDSPEILTGLGSYYAAVLASIFQIKKENCETFAYHLQVATMALVEKYR